MANAGRGRRGGGVVDGGGRGQGSRRGGGGGGGGGPGRGSGSGQRGRRGRSMSPETKAGLLALYWEARCGFIPGNGPYGYNSDSD